MELIRNSFRVFGDDSGRLRIPIWTSPHRSREKVWIHTNNKNNRNNALLTSVLSQINPFLSSRSKSLSALPSTVRLRSEPCRSESTEISELLGIAGNIRKLLICYPFRMDVAGSLTYVWYIVRDFTDLTPLTSSAVSLSLSVMVDNIPVY
jgi:hypothetical protein